MDFCSSHLKKKEVFHGNLMGSPFWMGKPCWILKLVGGVAQFLVGFLEATNFRSLRSSYDVHASVGIWNSAKIKKEKLSYLGEPWDTKFLLFLVEPCFNFRMAKKFWSVLSPHLVTHLLVIYPLVNQHDNGKLPFFSRKHIFKWSMFHSYVSLLEYCRQNGPFII